MQRARAEALLRPTPAATASPYAVPPGMEQAPEPAPIVAGLGLRDFSRIDSGVHVPAPPLPYQLALSSDLGRRMPRQKLSFGLPDLGRPRVPGLHGKRGLKLSLRDNLPAAASVLAQLRWTGLHRRPGQSPDPRRQWVQDLFEGKANLVPGMGMLLRHSTLERDPSIDPNHVFEAPGFRDVEVGEQKLNEDSDGFDPKTLIPDLKFPFDLFEKLFKKRPRGAPARPRGLQQDRIPSGGRDGTP